jgi:hypothetical protein
MVAKKTNVSKQPVKPKPGEYSKQPINPKPGKPGKPGRNPKGPPVSIPRNPSRKVPKDPPMSIPRDPSRKIPKDSSGKQSNPQEALLNYYMNSLERKKRK